MEEVVMRRNTIGSVTLAMIACAAVGVTAQTAGSQSQTPPPVRITVIGCVEPADQSATATGTRTSDTKYMLNRAKPGKNDTKGTTGTSGQTSGQTSGRTTGSTSASTASSYRLEGDDAKLTPEVGHQVEIIAVVEDPQPSAPAGTSGSRTAAANAPKLKVEEVRMIALTCPQ
jgi:hypothetical protein